MCVRKTAHWPVAAPTTHSRGPGLWNAELSPGARDYEVFGLVLGALFVSG